MPLPLKAPPIRPGKEIGLGRRFPSVRNQELYAPLSKRQWETALLVRDGLTNPEIAAHLLTTVPTVKSHIQESLVRLGLANRAALAVWADRTERRIGGPFRQSLHDLVADLAEELLGLETDVECLSATIRFLVEIRRAMEKHAHAQKESTGNLDAR